MEEETHGELPRHGIENKKTHDNAAKLEANCALTGWLTPSPTETDSYFFLRCSASIERHQEEFHKVSFNRMWYTLSFWADGRIIGYRGLLERRAISSKVPPDL